MKLERIQTVQRLPIQIEEAWDFFTSPKNLRLTTPHWLDLRLNTEPPEYLHPGMIVSATIRPFPILTSDWISELTHIRPPQFYITEQRVGPFKMWHHEHHFKSIDGGVEVEDIILYGMRFGMLGAFFHNVYVRKKLHEAFSFRAQALEQRFGSLTKPRSKEIVMPTISDVFEQQRPQPAQQLQQQQQKPQPKRYPSLLPPEEQTPNLRPKPPAQVQQPQRAQQPQKPPQRPQQPANQPRPAPKPDQQASAKPGQTPGKPVPQKVTLDDIFRGTED